MSYNLNDEINNVKNYYKNWRRINKNQDSDLYSILAKNLDIVMNIKDAYDVEKINLLLKQANIKVNKDSSIELKVIRLVMTSERKKASTYAKVLNAARLACVDSTGFVKWLEEKGGIEAVRKQNPKSIKKPNAKSKQEATKNIKIASSSIVTLPLEIPNTKKDDFVFLAARVCDNKKVEIFEIDDAAKISALVQKSFGSIDIPDNVQTTNVTSLNGRQTGISNIVSDTISARCNAGGANG